MEANYLEPIPIDVSSKRLFKRLGGKKGKKPSRRISSLMSSASEAVLSSAKTHGVYRILPISTEKNTVKIDGKIAIKSSRLSKVLGPCKEAVVFLITIGDEVDVLIKDDMKNRPHVGVALDAAASIAAECAAEHFYRHLKEEVGKDSGLTWRYSPGYCDWSVSDQGKLFKVLPHERLGVELSENCSMSPRKSISGIIGVYPADIVDSIENACLSCPSKNCPYRRTGKEESFGQN